MVHLRNSLYDHGILPSRPSSLPTICVGNLAVGGTGKTPHSEYLLRNLPGRKAYVSRGYRRHSHGMVVADRNSTSLDLGDEAFQIHSKFPDVQVVVSADRHLAVDYLRRRGDIDLVILDDAFQHRNIRATLNIILTDYASDPRHDLMLPAGRMRDSFASIRRADIVIVTKCPLDLSPDDMARKRAELNIPQPILFSCMRYGTPYLAPIASATPEPLSLDGESLLLFTGIEKPQPLIEHLQTLTPSLRTLTFLDHHDFSAADFSKILRESSDCRYCVTTEKDFARISSSPETASFARRLAVVPIEVDFLAEPLLPLIPFPATPVKTEPAPSPSDFPQPL